MKTENSERKGNPENAMIDFIVNKTEFVGTRKIKKARKSFINCNFNDMPYIVQ